jgi:hypothetical protein
MDRGRLEHSFNSRTIMAKKIVQPVEVQASVKGDESIKSFRAQLREAQQDALRLAEAFGETDARTVAAARKVADLKDRMDDVNATIASLHPDKFQAIANITGTMANGFAAAQGAAALLGGESEDLQKAMVRIQGAMAFAQGIAGLKDMQFMLVGIRTAIMTQVIPAFSTMAGAFMATGIGAAIAAVAATLYMFVRSAAKAKEEGEKLRKTIEKSEEAYQSLNQSIQETIQGDIADEIQLLRQRLSGQVKTEEEFQIKRLENLEKYYLEQRRLAVKGSDESVAFMNAALDVGLKLEKMKLEQQLRQQEEAEERRQANLEKRQAEAERKREEQQRKIDADNSAREAQRTAELEARWAAEAAAYKERKAEEAAAEKALLDEQAATYKAFEDGRAKVAEQRAERQKQADQAAFEHRRTIEAATSQSLGALASLFEQGSAAQKAFALAQIAADSGAAIGAALRNSQSPTPDNAATGGLAGLAKFAAIAAVIITNSARAVQIVKGGNRGGGIQALTPSGGGIQRPSLPASSTLGGGSQMAGQWNNKIYVTEGDITGTQRRVNMLRGASVI